MSYQSDLDDLILSYSNAPLPSLKVTSYFSIYTELFRHLRGTDVTFVETGVLNGGSLFMWRDWLGPKARIIGIDLNPSVTRYREHGFEIFVGDQGDPAFWDDCLGQIGKFDVLLDDGGHQSFQQIVTLCSAIKNAQDDCIIVIEDTSTSFMKEFSVDRGYNFLRYAKDSTDLLTARMSHLFDGQFPPSINYKMLEQFSRVFGIHFYTGIVAFRIAPDLLREPALVWNRPPEAIADDFRYGGATSANVDWPTPYSTVSLTVEGRGN
jgi:hypothetical protein